MEEGKKSVEEINRDIQFKENVSVGTDLLLLMMKSIATMSELNSKASIDNIIARDRISVFLDTYNIATNAVSRREDEKYCGIKDEAKRIMGNELSLVTRKLLSDANCLNILTDNLEKEENNSLYRIASREVMTMIESVIEKIKDELNIKINNSSFVNDESDKKFKNIIDSDYFPGYLPIRDSRVLAEVLADKLNGINRGNTLSFLEMIIGGGSLDSVNSITGDTFDLKTLAYSFIRKIASALTLSISYKNNREEVLSVANRSSINLLSNLQKELLEILITPDNELSLNELVSNPGRYKISKTENVVMTSKKYITKLVLDSSAETIYNSVFDVAIVMFTDNGEVEVSAATLESISEDDILSLLGYLIIDLYCEAAKDDANEISSGPISSKISMTYREVSDLLFNNTDKLNTEAAKESLLINFKNILAAEICISNQVVRGGYINNDEAPDLAKLIKLVMSYLGNINKKG